MALVSPGVQVNVINESFYTPAEPGTTPLIFVATKENIDNINDLRKTILEKAKTLKKPVSELKLGEI
jgi:hypothetical protein